MTSKNSRVELLSKIRSGKLLFPDGKPWGDFYTVLKSRLPKETHIPNPLILGGADAPDQMKHDSFNEHLKIAEENNLLDFSLGYLLRLSEKEWVISE